MSTTPPEFAYDVFISYSHQDKVWVRDELLPGLEKAGLKVCIDYRDFRVGVPIVKEMERAVQTSRHTLLVLTPAYLESAWADFEALMITTLDPGSQETRLLPLLLKSCDLPLRIRYLGYADFTAPDVPASSWQRLLDALGVSDDAGRQVQAPRPPQYEIPAETLDRYYEQIVRQYGWIRIFGQATPKPLQEVFTDVYMLDKPTALRRFDPDTLRQHLWERDRSIPFRYGERLPADQVLSRGTKFFILGKPGAGKTTFLKHLAVREAQRGKWGPCLGKIPIFIPLKQFSESGKPLVDFIVDQFAMCHFPDAAPFVEPLLRAGKALVLFDGLDEVARDPEARSDRRDQVTEQIEQFAHQYDGCHIAVTCRIAATEYMLDPVFIYLELADFALDQVEQFVRNWFWDDGAEDKGVPLAERMLAEWAKPENEGIRDLGRNPLLLTLLCLSYAETLSFPARRVEIYQEALDALLKKWDASRQIQRISLYRTLSLGRKQQMLSQIAFDTLTKGIILIPQVDLETRLKGYLVHLPEAPKSMDIDAETVLSEIVTQHGVLVEQSRGLFSFAHLTFQEYYVAKYLAESSAPDAFAPLLAHLTDDKWREVFLLTASLLPDATRFLAEFEVELHRLVAPRPRLIVWLRRIDEQAMLSSAAYNRSATRSYYATAAAIVLAPTQNADYELTRDPLRILDADLSFIREITRAIDYCRELAHDLDQPSARSFDLDRALNRTTPRIRFNDRPNTQDRILGRSRSIATMVEQIRASFLQLKGMKEDDALSSLIVPPMTASQADWRRFTEYLSSIVEAQGLLTRFRQLQAETNVLVHKEISHLTLDLVDRIALISYLRATQLFYDCLQLAYTPERRALEDRILLPPPLTEQKA